MANGNNKEEPKNGEEKKQEQQQVEAKKEDAPDYKEQMLRIAAEFDNYKKRVKGDMDGAKGIGKAELMKSLLPVIDEFELALMAIGKTEDKNMARGIEMLYSNFVDALKRDGLAEVRSDGTFDPYRHEIIMTRESDKRDGTILEVAKKGYTCNGVLLRPASVIVAKEGDTTK